MKRILFLGFLFAFAGLMTANGAVISGKVSNSEGTPLVNAIVSLRTAVATGAAATLARDTTDSSGTYSITCDSTSGTYVLRSTLAQYVTRNDSLVLDGTDKTADITLAAVVYTTVSGKVTDSSSGSAVAGAIVTLRNGNTTQATDTTGSDGTYSFDSVGTGTYTVRAQLTGYTTKNITATVAATALTVDIQLAAIQYSSVTGKVTDSATGTAIAGAAVSIRSGNTTVASDSTAADGTYSLDSVVTGVYTIRVTATDYVTKNVPDTLGATAQTVDILLAAIQYGSVTGKVTDSATGTAIAGALVTVRSGNTTIRTDSTAADGTYLLDSVAAGVYTIRAVATGYVTKNISNDTVGATAQTLDIQLVAIIYGSVTGKVIDSTTGTAIAGAVVSLRISNNNNMIDTAGSDGVYTIDSVPVATAMRRITASAIGYNSKIDSIAISSTTQQTLNFALTAVIYFAVSGTVTDSATGTPIAGAIVLLRSSTNATIDSVVTDVDGTYAIDSAYNGNRLRVSATGYTNRTINLTGTTSAAQTINVAMIAAPAVRTAYKGPALQKVTIAGGHLVLNNFNNGGTVRLLSMKGQLIYVKSFPACTNFSMQLGTGVSTGSYIIKIDQKNSVFLRRIVLH